MTKMTQKAIRNTVATDITNYNFEQVNELRKAHNLDKIGYSSGVYGINGGLLVDLDTNEIFKICACNSALAQLF